MGFFGRKPATPEPSEIKFEDSKVTQVGDTEDEEVSKQEIEVIDTEEEVIPPSLLQQKKKELSAIRTQNLRPSVNVEKTLEEEELELRQKLEELEKKRELEKLEEERLQRQESLTKTLGVSDNLDDMKDYQQPIYLSESECLREILRRQDYIIFELSKLKESMNLR